jgi:hypothetical protein
MSCIPDQMAQLSERLTRAEALLAQQRERVHQRRAAGLDIARSVALLEVWQQSVEQIRLSRRILQSFDPRLRPDGLAPQAPPDCKTPSPPLLPLRRTTPAAFLCPHCALTLRLKDDRNGTLVYDFPDWHRRCRHRDLESPALCQLISRDTAAVH